MLYTRVAVVLIPVPDDVVKLVMLLPPTDWFVRTSPELPLGGGGANLSDALLVTRWEALVKHGEADNPVPYALTLLHTGMHFS